MSYKKITRRQLIAGAAALTLTSCSNTHSSLLPDPSALKGVFRPPGSLQIATGLCDEVSGIYVILTTGEVLWYKDIGLPHTISGSQADYLVRFRSNGTGSQIGNGWQKFKEILYGGNGVIYTVDSFNNLFFFQDLARNGTTQWAPGSGNIIGTGWNFKQILGGENGVIFGLRSNGTLHWYQDLGRNGTTKWAPNSGSVIASGWNFARIIYAGGGVIYALQNDPRYLFWYRYTGKNGSPSWDPGSGRQVGALSSDVAAYFANYYGDLYELGLDDGQLSRTINLTRRSNPPPIFSTISSQQIGIGWELYKPVRGYCTPLSVAAGQTVRFRLAAGTGNSSVTVTIRRLTYTAPYGAVVAGPIPSTAVYQGVPDQPWSTDHGWLTTFSLTTSSGWASGLYAAECVDSVGTSCWITFIVRPAAWSRNKLAVLSHVNTWSAYNTYGGLNQYSNPNGTPLTFNRPNPHATPVDNHTFHDHRTRAELYILNWLDSERIGYDVYSDLDLHNGIVDLRRYRLVILSAHSEYWTDAMRANLSNYMSNSSGSLIYLGGNGIYERVTVDSTGDQLIFRNGQSPGPRDRLPPEDAWKFLGVSSAGLRGRGADATSYRVTTQGATHPFFGGSVKAGQDIGGEPNAYNGMGPGMVGASGWETDIAPCTILNQKLTDCASGYPPGAELLALGNNTKSIPATMIYYPKTNGGFVLSVGSITFGGALLVDSSLQTLIRNAINTAFGV